MGKYGIPYQGSKSTIAESIIEFLPSGKRFVDLFGGGAAMSHCAALSGKFDRIYYNELNPLLCDLLKRAINGKFNHKNFKPEFIDREEFYKHKDKDGYVKYIWSFGNNGRSYMFGADVEPIKRSIHNFTVFGIKDDFAKANFDDIDSWVTDTDIHSRRLAVKRYMRMKKKDLKAYRNQQQLQVIEHMQQLERLEQLEQLGRLEINNGSYLDYRYQIGDVVYCDPPYENTEGYGSKFDSKQFYDWVATRPYQVFFSSYEISDNRFKQIWQKEKQSLMNGGNGQFTVNEYIYTNKTIQQSAESPLSIFQSVLYG